MSNLAQILQLNLFLLLAIIIFCCIGSWALPFSSKFLPKWTQIIIAGACIAIAIFRLEFLLSISRSISIIILIAGSFFGAIYLYKKKAMLEKFYLNKVTAIFILVSTGFSAIFFNDAAFIRHMGPDLEGYLLSSAYQDSGGNYYSLMQSFMQTSQGSRSWYELINSWGIPDFRTAVSVEFFLRAARFGFQGLSVFFSKVFQVPIWLGHIEAMFFSNLISALIIDHILKINFKKINQYIRFILLFGFIYSPYFLILYFESIHAQLISMGFYIFIFYFLYKYISNQMSWQKMILPALVLSSAGTIFGEGLQIIGFSIAASIILLTITRLIPTNNQHNILKYQIKNLFALGIGALMIDPLYSLVFLGWTYKSIIQGFAGGALHIPTMPILYFFPAFIIETIDQSTLVFRNYQNLIEYNFFQWILIMVIPLVYFLKTKKILYFFCLVAFIPPLLMGNNYALFKVGSFYYPFIFIGCIFAISKITNSSKIIFTTLILTYSLINIYGSISTSSSFLKSTKSINFESLKFMESLSKVLEDHVVLSESPRHQYFLLGMFGPFRYINSGWGPKFKEDGSAEFKVLYFEDCVLEPNAGSVCKKNPGARIAKKIDDKNVSFFLDENGHSNQLAIDNFISKEIK